MIIRQFDSGTFYNADTFDAMALIPDGSVDMVLCDLPYGMTNLSWDCSLPLDKLWQEYDRVCKYNAAVVLTAINPFSAMLIMSNFKNFRYDWVWTKNRASGFLNAKRAPLRAKEDVLVFYRKMPTYNPQFEHGDPWIRNNKNGTDRKNIYNTFNDKKKSSSHYVNSYCLSSKIGNHGRYPKNHIHFGSDTNFPIHPTQKPVALFEYMIRAYTNAGETVLDNTAGSGTTAIAAINSGRKWICIERDQGYYEKACERIHNHHPPLMDLPISAKQRDKNETGRKN